MTTLCHKCLRAHKTATMLNRIKQLLPLLQQQRYASSWKRRVLKQERLKEVVYQYASKNTRRTDRVYVWGNSITGALGNCVYLIFICLIRRE